MTDNTNTQAVSFEIVDNLELPDVKRAGGSRGRGPFATAVASLDVGQGFTFTDKREIKKLYPAVAPKKFEGKKFVIRALNDGAKDEAGNFKYGVKRTA